MVMVENLDAIECVCRIDLEDHPHSCITQKERKMLPLLLNSFISITRIFPAPSQVRGGERERAER